MLGGDRVERVGEPRPKHHDRRLEPALHLCVAVVLEREVERPVARPVHRLHERELLDGSRELEAEPLRLVAAAERERERRRAEEPVAAAELPVAVCPEHRLFRRRPDELGRVAGVGREERGAARARAKEPGHRPEDAAAAEQVDVGQPASSLDERADLDPVGDRT